MSSGIAKQIQYIDRGAKLIHKFKNGEKEKVPIRATDALPSAPASQTIGSI